MPGRKCNPYFFIRYRQPVEFEWHGYFRSNKSNLFSNNKWSYIVTVTNGNGCSRTSAATTVTVNPIPTISISPAAPSAFCSGNSVTLTASGANSYTWSPITDLSITTGSVVIAYPSVTTTYTVTGTALNGCSSTANVPITVTQSPYGDVSSSPPVCPGSNGGTLTLSNCW